jgi:hypothetical protein
MNARFRIWFSWFPKAILWLRKARIELWGLSRQSGIARKEINGTFEIANAVLENSEGFVREVVGEHALRDLVRE